MNLLLLISLAAMGALSSAEGKASGFPKDFMWGSATAAYQCEGAYKEDGRGPSIWDVFSHIPGKVHNGDTGDVADDHYHRYEEDIERMAWAGFDFYRFSISPTRILPTGKLPVNRAGIEHYNKVIDLLLKKGMKPFVTLYHWDYPELLQQSYDGWLSEKSTFDFLTYAETCFKEFGDRVDFWLTFNEPWTFTFQGYGLGIHAPGRCSDRSVCAHGDSATEPYLAAHNVLRTHAYTVKMYREKFQEKQGGKIGITLNTDWAEPYSSAKGDLEAAERNMMFMFGWYAHPVFFGEYPAAMRENCGHRLPTFNETETQLLKGSLDFLGLNHYGSHFAMAASKAAVAEQVKQSPNAQGWEADMDVETSYFRDGKPIGKVGDSPWLYAAPWGFYKLLHWVKRTYDPKAIIVTENGVDVPGESDMPLEEALNDTFRREFYRDYIGAMRRAVQEGVPVKGYTAWSFLDNYEWADGYSKRFGLFYVDYAHNLTRHAKASVKWFRAFVAGNETAPAPHHIPSPPPPSDAPREPQPSESQYPPAQASSTSTTAGSGSEMNGDAGSSWIYLVVGSVGVVCAVITMAAICVYCKGRSAYNPIP